MVGAIGGIRSIFTSGVSGIRQATDNLARHAANIAHQSVVDYQDSVQFSSQGRALATRAAQSPSATPHPSIEKSLIGQMVAEHDLAANVASLKTADEVMKKLISLGDRRR